MTLTQPALRFRQHRHLECALAPIRLRHCADANIGARLDVGERCFSDAEHGHVGGKIDLHLPQFIRLYCEDMTIESVDSTSDANRLLLRRRRYNSHPCSKKNAEYCSRYHGRVFPMAPLTMITRRMAEAFALTSPASDYGRHIEFLPGSSRQAVYPNRKL